MNAPPSNPAEIADFLGQYVPAVEGWLDAMARHQPRPSLAPIAAEIRELLDELTGALPLLGQYGDRAVLALMYSIAGRVTELIRSYQADLAGIIRSA